MKLTSFAVREIALLLSSIDVKKYMECKKTSDNPEEYIVINALRIPGSRVQRCYVNVNCHAKDKYEGVPYYSKLDSMGYAVLGILQKKTTSNLLVDFESQETIREKDLGEHYMNLRFSVRIRNT